MDDKTVCRVVSRGSRNSVKSSPNPSFSPSASYPTPGVRVEDNFQGGAVPPSLADIRDVDSATLEGICIKGRYLIEKKIGSGGMSDIYRAKDLYLARAYESEPYVAIKVLQPQFLEMADAQQVVLREARKTQQLSHPNIIRVYDVDTDGDYHFMVMEWLDGQSLDEVINRSKPHGLSYGRAIKLIRQVADALDYAHQAGIVHTDLKPSNIMLTREGQIKLFDFGVARALRDNMDQYAVQEVIQYEEMEGYTPAYASPEQLEGYAASVQDDIYSFSCIVYELLSSKHPYNKVAANKAREQGLRLVKPNHISWIKWRILRKGLSFNSQERCTSIDEMKKAFVRPVLALFIGVLSVVFIIAILGTVITQQTLHLIFLENEVRTQRESHEFISSMLSAEPKVLLDKLELFSSDQLVDKEGILRLNRERILEYFDSQIAALPLGKGGRYPDYTTILAFINKAQSLYPDSLHLARKVNDLSISRQTLSQAFSTRLYRRLNSGKYEDSRGSIFELVEDIVFLEPEFVFSPSKRATDFFIRSLKSAISSNNVNQLEKLSFVGKHVFSDNGSVNALLEKIQ